MKMPNKHCAPSGRRPTLRMMSGGSFDEDVTLEMQSGGMFGGLKSVLGITPDSPELAAYKREQAAKRAAPPAPAPAPAASSPITNGQNQFNGVGLQERMRAAGAKNGGEIDMTSQTMHHTGEGGPVPGEGEGDKTKALYEKGEFVVSNDMLKADPGLREELHELREMVLAKKGMTPEEADAKAVGAKTLRAENAFGTGSMRDFLTADEAANQAKNRGTFAPKPVPTSNAATMAAEAAKAPGLKPMPPSSTMGRLAERGGSALRATGVPLAVAEGGWQATKAATNQLNSMSDDNLDMFTNAGGGDDTAFAAAILNEGRKTTASGKPGWNLPGVAPTPVAEKYTPSPAAFNPAARVLRQGATPAPTTPVPESPDVLAARKAERDQLTLRDMNLANSMQQEREGREAAAIANQAATLRATPDTGGFGLLDKGYQARRTAMMDATSSDGGRGGRARRLAGLTQLNEMSKMPAVNAQQAGETLRSTNRDNVSLRGAEIQADATTGAARIKARSDQSSALRDQFNKDRDYGLARETQAQTVGTKARENTRNEFAVYGADGKKDEAASQQSFDAVRQIFPGIESADEQTRNRFMADAKEMNAIFQKARTQDKVGWDAMKFWEPKRPTLSSMPNARGAATEQLSGVGGILTYGAENGDTLMTRDGKTLNLGKLTERQLELLNTAKTQGWGK